MIFNALIYKTCVKSFITQLVLSIFLMRTFGIQNFPLYYCNYQIIPKIKNLGENTMLIFEFYLISVFSR